MNRQQRKAAKKAAKKNKPPRPPDKYKPDAKTANLASDTVLLVTMTVLHDKFGFGTERLTRFYTQFQSTMDSLTRGFVSVYDLNEQLAKETGVWVFDREQYRQKWKVRRYE